MIWCCVFLIEKHWLENYNTIEIVSSSIGVEFSVPVLVGNDPSMFWAWDWHFSLIVSLICFLMEWLRRPYNLEENTVMIERRSLMSSSWGDVSVWLRTTIFPLEHCDKIRSNNSKPNRHNRSLWVTTISPIFPLIAASKRVWIPFLLKLRPDPISLIMTWLGNRSLKKSTCRWRSSDWLLVDTLH